MPSIPQSTVTATLLNLVVTLRIYIVSIIAKYRIHLPGTITPGLAFFAGIVTRDPLKTLTHCGYLSLTYPWSSFRGIGGNSSMMSYFPPGSIRQIGDLVAILSKISLTPLSISEVRTGYYAVQEVIKLTYYTVATRVRMTVSSPYVMKITYIRTYVVHTVRTYVREKWLNLNAFLLVRNYLAV